MSRSRTRRPSIAFTKLKNASAKRKGWSGALENVMALSLLAKDTGANAVSMEIKPNGRWSFTAKANGVAIMEAVGFSGPPPQFSAIPDDLRRRVFDKWGRECFYCATRQGPFHIDHKVPVAKGGTDEFDNLVPACRPCNLSKGAKLLEEWLPARVEVEA